MMVRVLFWDSNSPPLKNQDKTQKRTRTRTCLRQFFLFWAPFSFLSGAVQRQQGEAGEPVFAHVIARDMRQGGGKVVFGRGQCGGMGRVRRAERGGDAAPAPGA